MIQSDGKIIVGGQFSTYSGVTANGIVRLNTNGTKDASFLIGNGFAGQVVALALQGDGKVVAGGWFTSYSGSAVNYIVRLNSTGSKDTSFLIGSGFNSVVRSLKIQSDGKIIAGGMFTTYNGVTANGIIRLATNGINDGLFTVGSGFNYAINALAIQNTNGILVGGNFTTYNGVAAGYLVSLYGDSDVVILPNSTDTTTIVNRFTSKGYIQASGDLVGSKGISLTETNGNIPAALSLRNQDIKLTIPADTQFKKTDNVIPYNGIVSVPITKNISSVDNEQVISSFKVGSTSESIKLTGGVATLSVLASGKNIGDLVQIYYSEDNGVTRYPQTMGFVTNQNGLPYVSFTTNHFTDFAVTVPSGSFTGTFIINSGAVSTVSTGVILTISVAPAPTFMRFSNDGVNRSAREAYGISKSRSLGTGYGEKTVYVEFDTNGDGIYDIQTNDSITYVAPRSITYNKPAGTMTNSDVIATFTLNDSGTIVGTGIYTFTGNGTHTFDFLDASGTVGTAIATVTWIDKIAPVITINGISPMYIEYGLPYTEIGALWSDNNDGGGVVSAIAGSVNNLILGTYTITYTKIDVAGNTGTATRTVIVRDTIAPVVTLNGAATIYVEYGNTYAELGANWVDSRDGGGVVSSITGTVNISVLGTYTLTYTKIDTAGNTGTATRTVIVRDTTAPVVTLNGAATIYVEYGSTYTELGATWTDLRDGTGVVSIISGSVNTGTLGTYTLTYRKVDAAGNTGTINRSVVIRDTTAPVLTLNGAAIIYVEYGSSYTELGATWTDLRDGAGTVSIISGSVNTGLLGTYTLTYKRVDAAGNTGTINRSVVVRATTAPVVTLNGAAIVYVEYGSIYTELGAISTDLHDGTGPAIISGVVNTGVIGTYTLTYKKVDVAGNTGNTVTRTVIVRDTTIPEITAVTLTPNMLGAIAQITITQTISDFNGTNGASVYLLGPDGFTDTVALSLVSGDTHNGVRSGIYIFPAPATAIDGTYYISGSAIDLANNTGYHEIGQIILDRTAPTFSVVSITPNYVGVTGLVTINVSAQDMTLGISGINIKDVYSDISATLVSGTTFPTSPQEMGSWIFTQSVVGGEDIHIEEIITTDIVGNTRTATGSFIYDITAPILTLSGSNLIYIEYNSSYIELGATWTDEVDGSGVASNISGTVNTLSIGNYEILYSQEDRAGNVGTATRTVIVKDTIAPVVTLNGASTIYVEYGNDYSELGATWTDNVEGSGMVSMISGVVNTGVLGNYIVTYKKIDISNNTGTATRTVVVRDTTSPVVMLNGLGTVNIAYGNTYTELGATWNDLHDGTGNAISSGIVNTSIIGPYTIEYYRVDQSSNTGNIFRTVNVISAPIIPSVPSGGNGGSSILKKDTCPVSRDCSDSYYDSLCGKCSLVEKIVDKIPFHGAANKQSGSIAGSSFPLELNNAYLRAYGYNITTMPTIQRANMQGPLLRKDMAKMISSFAMNVLGKNVSTGANCTFSDMSSLPKEMQYYGIAACRLGLMGYASDGITLNKNFNPDEEVDRAQFGTILSRLLRGDKNNGGILYYQKHLQALKSEGIMTKIDTPLLGEMRGRVMVMMQRIFEKK
ncbi:MAG: DUF5011 domain-containing protein [candidate division SR1 bacterium]|nr:DUF5011 domain-containing protein [candidate division SR1 bacterium]